MYIALITTVAQLLEVMVAELVEATICNHNITALIE